MRFSLMTTKATAASGAKKVERDERVQRVHSIEEFDEALQAAKDKLVVVEYATSDNTESSDIYPFLVDLSRTCNDVEFLLVIFRIISNNSRAPQSIVVILFQKEKQVNVMIHILKLTNMTISLNWLYT